MPPAQYNSMASMTLIALCGLSPHAAWPSAERRRCTVTKGIMDYLEEHYGTNYAPNTRETFRRQVLHQFVQGGIADYNPFEPDLPTNSPKAHYAVTEFRPGCRSALWNKGLGIGRGPVPSRAGRACGALCAGSESQPDSGQAA